jgi:hypothetical protein
MLSEMEYNVEEEAVGRARVDAVGGVVRSCGRGANMFVGYVTPSLESVIAWKSTRSNKKGFRAEEFQRE